MLPPADYDLWLDTENRDKDRLMLLLRPCPDDEMEAYPVGFFVNDPKNDNAPCIESMQKMEGISLNKG